MMNECVNEWYVAVYQRKKYAINYILPFKIKEVTICSNNLPETKKKYWKWNICQHFYFFYATVYGHFTMTTNKRGKQKKQHRTLSK